jgi:hypothetical protein
MDSDFKHATEFLEAQSFTREPCRTCGGWSGWTRAEGNEKEMFVGVHSWPKVLDGLVIWRSSEMKEEAKSHKEDP